jgi:hypothetical protein
VAVGAFEVMSIEIGKNFRHLALPMTSSDSGGAMLGLNQRAGQESVGTLAYCCLYAGAR